MKNKDERWRSFHSTERICVEIPPSKLRDPGALSRRRSLGVSRSLGVPDEFCKVSVTSDRSRERGREAPSLPTQGGREEQGKRGGRERGTGSERIREGKRSREGESRREGKRSREGERMREGERRRVGERSREGERRTEGGGGGSALVSEVWLTA